MTVCRNAFARLRILALTALASCLGALPALAASGSRCVALAEAMPGVHYVSLDAAAPARDQVRITFIGHASFRIETGAGITIVTDYTGYAGRGPLPDVVTMNHAHSTHYTDYPDPNIKHVLRGWRTGSGPAAHNLTVGDVLIRNVTTDIRSWETGQFEKDGNSIFIFEVADMCIGHLGHLHHTLGPEYLGLIGQLDVVMVPVDGSYTMGQGQMMEVLKLLKARLVLPMHYFNSGTLSRFLSRLDDGFDLDMSPTQTITVSAATLPSKPRVVVLPAFEGALQE
ncbi:MULTISPECIES: MBL fold metallo-hydrolase [Rhodomicrobium]|uniref:MBL fold metallo-hydrolase n=1 Tax=Rhodomicrobium TaxID=1068 RepID=UPI000B4B9892|nr:MULTISPECIES: MBL fold metallo-hydrolase [Rhodomicrobium]